MNLRTQVEAKLDGLMSSPTKEGRFSIDTGNGVLHCKLADVNDLACAMVELRFQPADHDISFHDACRLGELLSERLNYLMEPIRTVESDGTLGVIQLRSCPPEQRADVTNYYELVIQRGGVLTLCRYTKPAGQPRRLTRTNVTREVVARLTDDLAALDMTSKTGVACG